MAFVHGHRERAYVPPGSRSFSMADLFKQEGGFVSSPPVLSQRSRQTFISAARATTETRILSLTHASTVSWMLSGSQVVRAPKIMTISRDECDGRWLRKGEIEKRSVGLPAKKTIQADGFGIPHATSGHIECILKTGFAFREELVPVRNGL